MKRNNGGFSLVEIVVAMAMLGAFATAACTSLVLAHRMNGKTDSMLQAQLAVSSAIETMMAEGIDATRIQENSTEYNPVTVADNVTITATQATEIVKDDAGNAVKDAEGNEVKVALPYYEVTVTSINESIQVTTHIREKYSPPVEDGGGA